MLLGRISMVPCLGAIACLPPTPLQDTIQLIPLSLSMTAMLIANPVVISRVFVQVGMHACMHGECGHTYKDRVHSNGVCGRYCYVCLSAGAQQRHLNSLHCYTYSACSFLLRMFHLEQSVQECNLRPLHVHAFTAC